LADLAAVSSDQDPGKHSLTHERAPGATRVGLGLAAAVSLAAIACVASHTRLPDSYWYTSMAEKPIIPGCSSIACFRVLVSWAMWLLPGVELKWRIYAVVFNALAALAVFDLSLRLGLSRRAALMAMALSTFGFGSLWTLFEPFNSDPFMFFLGPLVTRWLLEERIAVAFWVTAAGVLAKEFVVAPLAIYAIAEAWARRWPHALRAASAAGGAFVVWLALHFWLRHWFNYNYAGNASTRLSEGGYLVFWLTHEPLRTSIAAQFVEFGALYFLIPVGFRGAPRQLKALTLAAVPVACVFCYVQQPDRALWNFHFLTSPLSALALERVSNPLAIAFVALFAFANLRVGAQVSFVPAARYALAASTLIALIAIAADRRAASRLDRGAAGAGAAAR
jgi:hypothetical protein